MKTRHIKPKRRLTAAEAYALLTKEKLRIKMLTNLKKHKEEERTRKSRIIKDKLFKASSFKKAKKVMFYLPIDGEVDTREMIKEALEKGKTVYVPVCKKNRIMRPCVICGFTRLKKGLYGICEPMFKRFTPSHTLDLVVVPGVAFSKKGIRLGRGKGYYDKFLRSIPDGVPSIGLAYDFQILPHLPSIPSDINVKRVISN